MPFRLFPSAPRFGAVFGLILLIGAEGRCDDSETLLRRFRNDAPSGWARLEESESGLECVGRLTQKELIRKTSETREKTIRLNWRRRPGGFLVEQKEGEGEQAKTAVVATNEEYYFRIGKAASTKNAWRLETQGDIKTADLELKTFPSQRPYILPTTTYIIGGGRRLLDLMHDLNFKLERAELSGTLVRVHVSHTEVIPGMRSEPGRGSIVFDPTMNWAVIEYVYVSNEGKFQITCKKEFAANLIGPYRPLRTMTISSTGPSGTVERNFVMESVKAVDIPAEAFRLSAYDLPEPFGIKPMPKRWSIVTILIPAAILSTCLALLFRFLARRRRVASSGSH